MTIASAVSRISYTGNGSVDTYAYTFRIFNQADLLVTVRNTDDEETELTLTTDYTVTGVGDLSGGNVVLVNSSQAWLDGDGDLKTGYVITIRRVVDLVQETDIRNQGSFFPESHEDQFDYLTMIDQQQQDEINRSIRLPETIDPDDFSNELPATILDPDNAGRAIVINETNDGFDLGSGVFASLSDPLEPSLGGTGVSNNDAATLTRVGNHAVTLTTTGTTGVTLPTTGTLATLAGAEALTNKTLNSTNTITGATAASFSNSGTVTLPSGSVTLVARNTTDTLTNKDIDGGTASNSSRITVPKDTLANIQALTRKEGTILYATDTDKFYSDNGTVLTEVGSGSASGINYLKSNGVAWDFEDNLTTNWSVYANTAAATTPEVSPGGSPNVDFTFATSSSVPVRGTYSGLINKTANNRQGHGIRTSAMTIDSIDAGKPLTVSFDYKIASGTYSTGDIGVFMSDDTNIIQPSTVDIPGGEGTFVATFTATTSTSYRLIFHVRTTSASAYTVKLDNISVGPQMKVLGAAINDPILYTPTGSWASNVVYSGVYQRVGKRLVGQVNIRCTGAPSGTLSFSQAQLLPSGLTLDTTVLPDYGTSAGTSYDHCVGNVVTTDNGVGEYDGFIYWDGTASIFRLKTSTTSSAVGPAITATSPFTFGSQDLVVINFDIPITNWSSNIQLAQSREEFLFNTTTDNTNDTTSFGYGAAGSTIPNRSIGTQVSKRVRAQSPIQPTDKITVELLPSGTGNTWVDAAQWFPYLEVSTTPTRYGISYERVSGSNTDVDVVFRAGGYNQNQAATYAANGSPWSDLFTAGWKWRVRKCSGVAVTEVQQGGSIRSVANRITSGQTVTAGVALEVIFNNEREDTHAAFSTSTGRFTAPIGGVYMYSYSVNITTGATPPGYSGAHVRKNGSTSVLASRNTSTALGGTTNHTYTCSGMIRLNAGDYISVWAECSTQNITVENCNPSGNEETSFQVALLGVTN